MKVEIDISYVQESELRTMAEHMGVSLEEYVAFLLDEHTDQSYDRRKRLEISRVNRKRYFN